jgi:hypothetical protein
VRPTHLDELAVLVPSHWDHGAIGWAADEFDPLGYVRLVLSRLAVPSFEDSH